MGAKGQQLTIAAIALTVALFLASTAFISVQNRLATLEQSQSDQNQQITAMKVQLDLINTRGTTGADSRLNSLETRVGIDESKINRLETPVTQH